MGFLRMIHSLFMFVVAYTTVIIFVVLAYIDFQFHFMRGLFPPPSQLHPRFAAVWSMLHQNGEEALRHFPVC